MATPNSAQLEEIARLLLERESLDATELQAVLDRHPVGDRAERPEDH